MQFVTLFTSLYIIVTQMRIFFFFVLAFLGISVIINLSKTTTANQIVDRKLSKGGTVH